MKWLNISQCFGKTFLCKSVWQNPGSDWNNDEPAKENDFYALLVVLYPSLGSQDNQFFEPDYSNGQNLIELYLILLKWRKTNDN